MSAGKYAERVGNLYAENRRMLVALGNDEPEEWSALGRRLFGAAHKQLCRWGWEGALAYELAREAAQEVCLRLHTYGYPCDVLFDVWAFSLPRRCIVAAYWTHDPIARPPTVGLPDDEWQPGGPALDPANSDRIDLLRALERLSTAERRQAIEFLFVEGLTPEKIAARLGTSIDTAYSLNSRALGELRALLQATLRRPEPARSPESPGT